MSLSGIVGKFVSTFLINLKPVNVLLLLLGVVLMKDELRMMLLLRNRLRFIMIFLMRFGFRLSLDLMLKLLVILGLCEKCLLGMFIFGMCSLMVGRRCGGVIWSLLLISSDLRVRDLVLTGGLNRLMLIRSIRIRMLLVLRSNGLASSCCANSR